MLVEERRTAILNLLQKHGKVRVRDLSRRFKTSEVTIRWDLNELHQRGLLRKAHGGALPPEPVRPELPLQARYHAHAAEKARIGAAAAALIGDGQTIILDSGTTTQQIAKRIKEKQNLTVITNGVNVAMELVGVRGVQVVLLGGVLHANAFSVVGHFAEEMLGQLSADLLFLATDACDLEFGVSSPNMEESRVNRKMVSIARKKILVSDSSKFGRRGLARIVALEEMNHVITDDRLPEDFQREILRRGIELTMV